MVEQEVRSGGGRSSESSAFEEVLVLVMLFSTLFTLCGVVAVVQYLAATASSVVLRLARMDLSLARGRRRKGGGVGGDWSLEVWRPPSKVEAKVEDRGFRKR